MTRATFRPVAAAAVAAALVTGAAWVGQAGAGPAAAGAGPATSSWTGAWPAGPQRLTGTTFTDRTLLSDPSRWFFLDGVDVLPARGTPGDVVVLGDSITDGAYSAWNGNKRGQPLDTRHRRRRRPHRLRHRHPPAAVDLRLFRWRGFPFPQQGIPVSTSVSSPLSSGFGTGERRGALPDARSLSSFAGSCPVSCLPGREAAP
ncbi:hypothetical protein ACFPM7_22795 [Actinokineospora guangxiensis]|uniref:GDSL-like lipase/acylhydrolase family protein n=1 Tax=Actinokineospora guangxiensis TaxID=1490288 RepID=A0ABW0EU03_9PSEU